MIGQLIWDERKKQGLTQVQLAERAGLAQNQISRIEISHTIPPFDFVCRILEALGLSIQATWDILKPQHFPNQENEEE